MNILMLIKCSTIKPEVRVARSNMASFVFAPYIPRCRHKGSEVTDVSFKKVFYKKSISNYSVRMGNCLPSCQRRNKVVPLRINASNSTQVIPRYKPVTAKIIRLSPSFGRRSSVRSIKPAAIGQDTTVVPAINEIPYKLSNISLISVDNSIDSVLVRCVRSNSEFHSESLPSDRPRPPTLDKIGLPYTSTELASKYCVQSQTQAPGVDTPKEGQDSTMRGLGNESPEKLKVAVKEESQVEEDHATGTKKRERPVSSKTYIVKYEDSYLRKKAREMSELRKASRMVAPTTNDKCPDNGGDIRDSSTEPERSVSAFLEQSDEEQARDTVPRRERPKQADYKARRPNFTSPLIIGDVSEEDFQGVLTAEDRKTDDADESLFTSDIQEAIDYILTDKPLSKEELFKDTGDKSQVEDDEDIIAANESECDKMVSPRQNYKACILLYLLHIYTYVLLVVFCVNQVYHW